MPPLDDENATFATMKMDAATKDDGRYLIYYSWPDAGDGDERREAPA